MDEETRSMPTVKADGTVSESASCPPPPTRPSGHARKHRGGLPWKPALAAVLAFLLGIGMASCGSQDPKDSQDYKDLSTKYSKTAEDLRKTREELGQARKDLEQASGKARLWDKEQADKKAAEEQAAKEKAAKEQADQEQAQRQAQQQQAQEQARQQAQQPAAAPAAPEPRSGGGPTVHRGAFCTPAGATGQSDHDSNILTCRPARGGRLRWMN